MHITYEMRCVFHGEWIPIKITLVRKSDNYCWQIDGLPRRVRHLNIFGQMCSLQCNLIRFDESDFNYISGDCVGYGYN